MPPEGPLIKLSDIFKLLVLLGICPSLYAGHLTTPLISIIIDDIGYRNIHDTNALSLPGPVTYAIMPHAPHSVKLSNIASQSGKTVILHLPMEAMEPEKNRYLGPGALRVEMKETQFISTLSDNLDAIPNIIGVNNHMGSLLTSQSEHMEWL
ncbi:MAG: divergent polysaccharide deacetylase family protein, partial [Gammaproteobacteria bacterium]|nr:divergent polysaccharide deacetylase family protein [Gammaproteobacteria bacterium]